MKNIYLGPNSDYLQMTENWHVQDSPWKAEQILKMIKMNKLCPKSIVEVGCGAGEILYSLDRYIKNDEISFKGYDIASDAIRIATSKKKSNVEFYCDDFTNVVNKNFDLLLMIDVFEHVPDYMGFIKKCNNKARYKIFHIPLDIHISGILRNKLIAAIKSVGHLHYFTKETAIAALEDTGLRIIDYFYTDGSKLSKKTRTKVANILRKLIFPLAPDFIVKFMGGYSLLVLAE